MTILDRYVLRALVGPFIFALSITTFILILGKVFDYLDLLVGKGVEPVHVAELFLLSLGWIVALSAPMAMLVASLMAFIGLSADNEVTAMRSTGIHPLRIMFPVFVVAGFLAWGMVLYHNHVLPETNHRLASLLVDIHRKQPAIRIREGMFMDDFPGYSLLVEEVDAKESRVKGVTILRHQADRPPQTIRARDGLLNFSEDGNRLTIELHDGEIHDVEGDRYLRLRFNTHLIHLTDAGRELVRTQREYRSDREMSTQQMLGKVQELRRQSEENKGAITSNVQTHLGQVLGAARSAAEGTYRAGRRTLYSEGMKSLRDVLRISSSLSANTRQEMRYWVEIHKKFAIPVACVIFALLGAPLGIRTSRGGVGGGIGLSLVFFLLYYICLIGGEKLADRDLVYPGLAMWLANIVLGIFAVVLLVHAVQERPFWPDKWAIGWGRRAPETGGQ